MKITFVLLTAHPNGGTRVVANYAKALLARGHDVTVISRRQAEPSWKRRAVGRATGRPAKRHDEKQTVYLQDLGANHVELPWQVPLQAEHVPDADIIIATWWRTAFEVAALPASKGAKVYFVQGHEIFDTPTQDLAHGSYHLPLHKITASGWLTRTMADLYGDRDVTTIPNGVDTALFDAPVRSMNTRPKVGFIYSTLPLKGADILHKAIAICRENHPDFDVVAFGHHDPLPASPLPAGTVYHKSPPQSMIPQLYTQCDAWLLGSRFEGFGLPILEAMACRTPVIATAAGAAPDLIQNGTNGYVVPVEDAEALATGLHDLLSASKANWAKMSQSAYDCAQQHSWVSAADAFEAALTRHVGPT